MKLFIDDSHIHFDDQPLDSGRELRQASPLKNISALFAVSMNNKEFFCFDINFYIML